MHLFRRWCGLDWFQSTTDFFFAFYFQKKTIINWFVDRTALPATAALSATYIILNVYPSAFQLQTQISFECLLVLPRIPPRRHLQVQWNRGPY